MNKFVMRNWNGLPVPFSNRREWIEDMQGDRGEPGGHSLVMSGDSMVLILWGKTPAEDECYDLEVRRRGLREP